MKEWSVDIECDVEVTLTTTVEHAASLIIDAETAEEAFELAKEELAVLNIDDLDLTGVKDDDYEIGEPENFRLEHPVKEWSLS